MLGERFGATRGDTLATRYGATRGYTGRHAGDTRRHPATRGDTLGDTFGRHGPHAGDTQGGGVHMETPSFDLGSCIDYFRIAWVGVDRGYRVCCCHITSHVCELIAKFRGSHRNLSEELPQGSHRGSSQNATCKKHAKPCKQQKRTTAKIKRRERWLSDAAVMPCALVNQEARRESMNSSITQSWVPRPEKALQ